MIKLHEKLGKLAVSFIVDSDPIFAYTGWQLANSISNHVRLAWQDIHVQFTPEVPDRIIKEFRSLGCSTHRLARFGDGRYCNKLGQWENLRNAAADHFVLLDTDMICVDDFSTFLPSNAIGGKVVDLDNPPLHLLETLFSRAGFHDRPAAIKVEAKDAYTYRGNCNGGFYSIPRRFADDLFKSWQYHALNLLDDIEPLRLARKENHVDQVSFCMAIHQTGLPFEPIASNTNYYVHFAGVHSLRDTSRPLALLHYHNGSLNALGLLDPAGAIEADEIEAVRKANDQINAHFHSKLFSEFRERHFPERGSEAGQCSA